MEWCCYLSDRTLRELDEEAKAGASSLNKKKRDNAFLRQKSEQYKQQVAALEVIVEFYINEPFVIGGSVYYKWQIVCCSQAN